MLSTDKAPSTDAAVSHKEQAADLTIGVGVLVLAAAPDDADKAAVGAWLWSLALDIRLALWRALQGWEPSAAAVAPGARHGWAARYLTTPKGRLCIIDARLRRQVLSDWFEHPETLVVDATKPMGETP